MCIAQTTAPTARRRTSLLYEEHKRRAKFRWNSIKVILLLAAIWYLKWTTVALFNKNTPDDEGGRTKTLISSQQNHQQQREQNSNNFLKKRVEQNHPVTLKVSSLGDDDDEDRKNDGYENDSDYLLGGRENAVSSRIASSKNERQQKRLNVPDSLPVLNMIARPICGAQNQPCAHGTCNEDQTTCVCSKIYVGDLCDTQIKLSGKKLGGSLLANWNLPYEGPIVMSKSNLGKHMNTRKTGVLQLDLANGEVPRFLGPIGPPLLEILPNDDIFRGNKLFFPTCAVVGNSGSLKSKVNRNRAAEIDAHDVVIRFNDAKTDSIYASIVGKKTSIRVLNAKHFGFRESDDEFVVQQMRSPQAFRSFMGEHRRNPGIPLYTLHPDFASYVIKSFPKIQTSVGFQGVLMALMSCGSVNVYGLALGPNEGFSQSYFRPDSDDDLDAEDDNRRNTEVQMLRKREQTEWKALSAMNFAGLITFRDKCVENCHVSRARCEQCMKKQEKVVSGEIEDDSDSEESEGDEDEENAARR